MSSRPELSRMEPSLIGEPCAGAGKEKPAANAVEPAAVSTCLRDIATTRSFLLSGETTISDSASVLPARLRCVDRAKAISPKKDRAQSNRQCFAGREAAAPWRG